MVLRQAQQEVNRAYTEAKRALRNSAGAWRLSASTRRVRSTRLSRKSGELGYPITLSSARTPVTAMGLCISADAAAETDLIAFLRDHAPVNAADDYGRGHPQAAGGSLPVAVWNGWTAALGFGGEVAA